MDTASMEDKDHQSSSSVFIIIAIVLIIAIAGILYIVLNKDTQKAPNNGIPSQLTPTAQDDFESVSKTDSTKFVSISGLSFPDELIVKIGDTINWTNNDSMQHTVTFDTINVDSDTLSPGESFEYTFTQPGEFVYRCDFHPTTMIGKVIVQ